MFKIYQEIFEFFKTNIQILAIVVAITELPLILLDNFLPGSLQAGPAFAVLILGIVVVAFSNGTLTAVFSMIFYKEQIDIKQALTTSLNYLPRMLTGILIYGLLIILGVICFILPGIIIGARLSLYNYYIIYEDMEPVEALKESFRVTTGFTWEVTALFMVMFFIATIPYLVTANYLHAAEITNPLFLIVSDYAFSVLGTLVPVLTFRIYCMIKEKNGIYFD
ncbi:MAG: YciC family protein [Thermodesulfobacteriota bacterium]